ncbi:MAG TPA: peptidoglycan DD-metalloendopeptidase family protein, partial [Anaerolineales bacterium]|nr:peptidoglycan DD-metalloendopeptidase family protein [Anaerolineales bacterium]
AAGGTVTSGTSTCEGNWVKIHHGDYLTYYAHLQNDAYWLRSGTVVAGDRIGTVGNSGTCSKGAHLHFQVYYDQNHDGYFSYPNEVVDPYGWRDQCSTIGSDPWTVTFTDRYNISHTGATSTWLWDFGQPTCARVSGLSSHSFASEDGVTISIPAGAVIQDVTLGYNLAPEPESADMTVNNPLTSAETIPVGHTFQLSGVYVDTTWLSTFAIPVSLTVIYEDEELLYGDEGSLMLYAWQPGTASWMPLVTTLNTENNSAQAWTDRAGIFSLRAQPLQAAPVVSGVTPVEVSNVGMVNITIEGVNFSPTPTVNLWVGGLEVSFVSSSELTAVIPAGLAPGSYDLIVRNPDGQTVVVPDAITIKGIFFLPLMLR